LIKESITYNVRVESSANDRASSDGLVRKVRAL